MPDMPAVFQQASSPPKVDIASAHSHLYQVPSPASASSSLYSLSVSRKRPRRDTEKLSSTFDPDIRGISPLILSTDNQTAATDDLHKPAELDCRPNRYRESFLPPSLDASVDSVGPGAPGTSRKRSRRDSCIASPTEETATAPENPPSWGRTVINAVGKVLDICWSGAFRGFYAGGGQGYDMAPGPPAHFSPKWRPVEKEHQTMHTPIPGQFPEDDNDIDRTWVVVPEGAADEYERDDLDASPSMKVRRNYQVSSPRRRSAVMPRLAKRSAGQMRPSTPSKNLGPASPRARDGPGSADMQRYAAKMRRKEREEDASIQRLNKQLQAMIREGREALGTTVEVDDVEMDSD
ncbi:hypothetical protein N7468_005377 [Penicillium chermesinum]|uniref:Uncharacterized protein n=1 Tax=Penicillium chermesinum TaxID=63820 RepID=A0A9W9NZD3_9EURO|nr:uncharacterized protein N7468_005377 [Penicillium chermesinum]KAJ5232421.1 hypothetical protein N7468_005377 [Penicillium chermesinum]